MNKCVSVSAVKSMFVCGVCIICCISCMLCMYAIEIHT